MGHELAAAQSIGIDGDKALTTLAATADEFEGRGFMQMLDVVRRGLQRQRQRVRASWAARCTHALHWQLCKVPPLASAAQLVGLFMAHPPSPNPAHPTHVKAQEADLCLAGAGVKLRGVEAVQDDDTLDLWTSQPFGYGTQG